MPPPTRRLAVVTTCRNDDVVTALAVLLPGVTPLLVQQAGKRTGVAGAAAALIDCPRGSVSDLAAQLRRMLREVTRARTVLVGVAVDDAGCGDEQLLILAAEALISGHGVASDHSVIRRRLRRATSVSGLRGQLRTRYVACSAAQKRWFLVALTMVVGLVLPFVGYCVADLFGLDLAGFAFWVILAVLILTAASIVGEMLYAVAPPDLPRAGTSRVRASDPILTGRWPKVSLIVAAYLANEIDVLQPSVDALLHNAYPGEIEVVVAANGEGDGVPELLKSLSRRIAADARLRLVVHPGSRSKAENINAAMEVVSGEIVGVLDADHQLSSTSITRAARWIAGGYADVVQGHNVIRNGAESLVAQTVAVEFEGIYALAHPGRARLHGFGIFGGSNGFWRRDLLDRLRMRPWMLTEDIDVSTRALLSGAVIASDRWLVSRELAPSTLANLWTQRMRWSQGWLQVSARYLWPALRGSALSFRQRSGIFIMFGLREIYPWMALQMFPLVAFQLGVKHNHHVHWLLPPFVLAGLVVTGVGPLQVFAAWRFSAPEMRERHRWFISYLFRVGPFYGEWKAIVNRCAHIRQWLGDDAWTVTPRSGNRTGLVSAQAGAAEVAAQEATASVAGAPPVEVLQVGSGRSRADRSVVPEEVIQATEDPSDTSLAPVLRLPLLTYADADGQVKRSLINRLPRPELSLVGLPLEQASRDGVA